MTESLGEIRVGTAAWADHQEFYPRGTKPGDRISYYARHFPVVEVNASYYHIMPARNYALWAEKTPPGFQFNVKALGQLTGHVRESPPTPEVFAQFRASYQPLREAGKLAAVLFGFPPWFDSTTENKQRIVECVEQMADDPIVVEFRNTSWLAPERQEESLGFLRELGVSYVTVDAPQIGNGTAQKVVGVTNPRLAYLRMHGRNKATWYKRVETTGERFNYLYNQSEIDELAGDALELARHAYLVHVIFNNNMQNYAVENSRMLVESLQGKAFTLESDQPMQRTLEI